MAMQMVHESASTVKASGIPELIGITYEFDEWVGLDSAGREYYGQTRSEVMQAYNDAVRVMATHLMRGVPSRQDILDAEYWRDARETASLP